MSAYGQALVTVPSRERVGAFPALVVIMVVTVVFLISFAPYMGTFDLVVHYHSYFPADILDVLVTFSLPASLLFAFVFSQVRMRLNLHWLNVWSIIHSVVFVVNFIQAILYILARPRSALSFLVSDYQS